MDKNEPGAPSARKVDLMGTNSGGAKDRHAGIGSSNPEAAGNQPALPEGLRLSVQPPDKASSIHDLIQSSQRRAESPLPRSA